VSLIAGYGLLAFRDPFGIRPLCIGKLETEQGTEWMVASESVAAARRITLDAIVAQAKRPA
uniref:hypothetical protein n=1 Tax=Burkholderia mallei TaxID=13373 RepID=UPI00235DD2E9